MDYQFATKPFEHQLREFERTSEHEFHGLLWEQGCGKTKYVIDVVAYLYEQGKVDSALIVAPNGVERNWVSDEIPKHLPKRIKSYAWFWRTHSARAQWHKHQFEACVQYEGLIWLCMSYDSFMTEAGKKAAWRFLRRRRVFYVLDESDDIKTPKAKRTKSIVASGKYAPYRRILTGTPADKPFDLYTQLRFLDPTVWSRRGMSDFLAFKTYFGEWGTGKQHVHTPKGVEVREYPILKDYKNLEELTEITASLSSRLLKTDVLDLPDKLYTKRYFEMTPKQQGFYDELRHKLEIELESGAIVDGTMALTRLLRLQQITCGYMITDDDEEPKVLCDKTNPRLEATVDTLKRLTHPAIVWCRFTHDVDQLMDSLGNELACRYDGQISPDEAETSKLAFNAGDKQFFIGNTAKGSRGLTLNAAKTTVYYSNSFKLRDRLQSEDRNHRYGQDGTDHGPVGFGVLYVDVLAAGTVDMKIVDNLRGKFDIAAKLTGDVLREWI